MNALTEDQRHSILDQWREVILQSYPRESIEFLKNKRNQFANPVGTTIRHGTEVLWGSICDGKPVDEPATHKALEELVKIRAVQEEVPSKAMLVLSSLKGVLRRFQEDSPECRLDQLTLSNRIDEMILAGFDIYSQCRETMYNIRINDMRNRMQLLMKRMDFFDLEEETPATIEDGNGANGRPEGGAVS